MASRLVRVNPVTVNDVLDGHVGLDMECLDRIYLNGYRAESAGGRAGGVVSDGTSGIRSRRRRSWRRSATAFRRAVARFADANHIPVVRFGKDDRKIDVMRRYLDSAARHRACAGGRDRGGAGVRAGVHRPPARHRTRQAAVVLVRQGRPAGDLSTTFTSGTTISGRRSSRSAPTSRTRSRSGSTATSGPNARPPRPGSGSPSCPTGSPPPPIPLRCRRSATGSARARSGCSPNAGGRSCRCR